MTILVVLVGMLAGLAWFLPEAEANEKKTIIISSEEYERENPQT